MKAGRKGKYLRRKYISFKTTEKERTIAKEKRENCIL